MTDNPEPDSPDNPQSGNPGPETPTVAAFAPDLMDQSKIRGALDGVKMIRAVAKLADADADVVVVDLSRAGVLEAIEQLADKADRPHVIGFGSHVDDALLAAAEQTGCDEVLPRSVFFKRLSTRKITGL